MEKELVEYSVIFKDINGYIGKYQITSDGRVFNKQRERFLTLQLNSGGYLNVLLSKNSKKKKYFVHRLVAIAFINNIDNKPWVDHVNGNKTNNKIDNLRWVTSSENAMNKRVSKNNKLNIKGVIKFQKGYRAQIIKDKKLYVKNFETIEECTAWRKQKEIELFGEYAYKN